jgi:hypothetical protein
MPTKNQTDLLSNLPCLHVLRASGLAVDPKKMLIGGLALCVLILGDGLIARLPFAPESEVPASVLQSEYLQAPGWLREVGDTAQWSVRCFHTGITLLISPVRSVLEPGLLIMRSGSSWQDLAWAWTRLLWALLVWSLAGGAIARMAALQFAQKRRISISQAVRFAGRQFLGYLTAPFLPLAGILCLLGFMALDSWLASLIPVAGDYIISAFWIVAIFFGFLMAMMLTGFTVGWPLMISAISTEDSDGFDGLSRAIGFWFDRPWYAFGLIVLSIPVFVLAWALVSFLIGTTLYLAAWGVSAGAGSSGPPLFDAVANTPMLENLWWNGWLNESPASKSSLDTLPTAFVIVWTYIPAVLLAGFGPSFFWCATTVIYFLLRESDDGTALTEVADWRQSDQPAADEPAAGGPGDSTSSGGDVADTPPEAAE